MALDATARAAIVAWAVKRGLAVSATRWVAWQEDEEGEWRYSTFMTSAEAIAEVSDLMEDSIFPLEPNQRRRPGGEPLVESVEILALTPQAVFRAERYPEKVDAMDMAVAFFAEDVLRASIPSVVGVWWREDFNPESLSAPRGAIFPNAVQDLPIRVIDWNLVDGDEEMIDAMPTARLLSPDDFNTPYNFVTDCVSSTSEMISPMVDSPSSRTIPRGDFVRELGSGDVASGEAILSLTFPCYHRTGLQMSKDRHVNYMKSSFNGLPCIYVVHSAVEYVFQREGLTSAHQFSKPERFSSESDCSVAPAL